MLWLGNTFPFVTKEDEGGAKEKLLCKVKEKGGKGEGGKERGREGRRNEGREGEGRRGRGDIRKVGREGGRGWRTRGGSKKWGPLKTNPDPCGL